VAIVVVVGGVVVV